MEEIGQEEVGNSNAQDEKGKATGADEDSWRGGSQVDRKATERVSCRSELVWRMDPIAPIWQRRGDVHEPGKYRGSHHSAKY